MSEPITVLLVDEDRDILDITATFLERESERLDVETVTRTAEALDILETDADAVDCVVSDYTMPGMTGVEFLESVRDRDPDLPFFFFTGRERSEIQAQIDADAIDGYVQKGTGTGRYTELADDIVDTVED